jgi:hypothetical protein
MKFVDKIAVCEPIQNALELFLQAKGQILKSEIGDYHFHELRFKINNLDLDKFNSIVLNLKNIDLIKGNICACDCHWSTIELIEGEKST